MPSGAKKRKALKKKREQEAIRVSANSEGNNGNNLHGNDDLRSQDEKESDGDLSSPGSQGNEEAVKGDPSAVVSSVPGKDTEKEGSGDADITHGFGLKGEDAIAIERELKYQANNVEKPPNSFLENLTQTTGNVTCEEASVSSVLETIPVVDSIKTVAPVSEVLICEKSEHVETSADLNFVKQKSYENDEKLLPTLEEDKEGKVLSLSEAVAEAGKEDKSVKESEIPECSEEKPLLASGRPIVQKTSWLSCCGLFDVMTGSDR